MLLSICSVDRLTTDMASHDQVRLILNSHQLDRSISLPFLPREKLTCFLAAVERSFHLRWICERERSPRRNLSWWNGSKTKYGKFAKLFEQETLFHSNKWWTSSLLSPNWIKILEINVFYHHDNHYDVITSMPAFLARKQYCHKYKKGYDKVTSHPCGDLCKLCHTQKLPCRQLDLLPRLQPLLYKSDECFARHKDATGQKKALYTSLTICQICQRVVTRASLDNHHCGLVRCIVCQKYVEPSNHQCYIQPIETRNRHCKQPNTAPWRWCCCGGWRWQRRTRPKPDVFWLRVHPRWWTTYPNLCVVQNESGDEKVFLGPNTRDEFCEWLFTRENANLHRS